MKTTVFLSILFILSSTGFAATLYVPDDFPTIQEAISAGEFAGDTIIVRPGTYVENIDFVGKAIHLKSEKGPVVTVIDGNQDGSVVKFENSEGFSSKIEGFTIRNGSGSGNHPSQFNHGGGIFCFESSPTIVKNMIIDNTLNSWGANGGGICCESASPRIENNCILQNEAENSGGGIMCGHSSPAIVNNLIGSNSTQRGGGGGIYFNNSSPEIRNNTIVGNSSNEGGCVEAYFNSSPTIINTILRYNDAPIGPEICIKDSSQTAELTISYSDVAGGQNSVFIYSGCILNWGAGMIDADPHFETGPEGDYYLSQVAAGQTVDSPCVDSHLKRDRRPAPIPSFLLQSILSHALTISRQCTIVPKGENCGEAPRCRKSAGRLQT